MLTRHLSLSMFLARFALAGLLFLVLFLFPTIDARANLGLSKSNDLYGVKWGISLPQTSTATDLGWADYFEALPTDPNLAEELKKYIMTPRALVLGGWWGLNEIESIVTGYIAKTTGGDPSIGVQFVVDRVRPWECDACNYLPRAQDVTCFKSWIDTVARAIGGTRAVIIVQPDSYFATCAPHYSNIYKQMIKYAVNVFRKLPRVSVYIDGQSSDWSPYDEVAALLAELGVGLKGVRGFTLGQTHMAPDADQYKFGKAVVNELARVHKIKNRHFIVNRMLNGHPLRTHINGKPNSAFFNNVKCSRPGQTNCFAFGRPPYVTKSEKYCDGYLWFGTFGMRPPTSAELAGMAEFSPSAAFLPPTSTNANDREYEQVLAEVVQRADAPSNSPLHHEVITASSFLINAAGQPDLKHGWYGPGDPRHSTAAQRANVPQKHPCQRSDYAPGASHQFQYPKCYT